MSGGTSKSSSQNSSQNSSNSQTTLDPQVKAALLQNYSNFDQNVPGYTPYSGTTVAGLTPAQTQSFGLVGDIANNQTGAAPLNSGIAATQGVAGYAPNDVTPQTLASTNISQYLSPYLQDAVGTTEAAAQNALGQTENQNASDATKAGAWRGNALQVENAIDEGQSNIGVANTVAGLENTGYDTALGAATTDVNNNLAAQQSNQSAGLAGANLKLTAGSNLANMGEQQLSDAAQRASLLNQVGTQQQQQNAAELQFQYQNGYLNPQQYAMALQQLRNQTLGLAGDPTIGTASSQGTASGSSTSTGLNFSTFPSK